MIRQLSFAAMIAALGTAAAAQQSGTDQQQSGDAAGQATTTEQAAPPPPDYNGSVSGTAAGSGFSIQVVCEGFAAGGAVTMQSDPGGTPGEDLNGDGQVVDISASPDGSINLQLQANNSIFSLADTTAQISGNTLSYQITMTFSGGATEKIELTGTCNE